MAMSAMSRIVQHLRKAAIGEGEGFTDGQLLQEFLHSNDEAAFTALVRRHGPMVLGTCQRILQNLHDAEDAFQATFLVLVRKAGSFLERKTVGDWLYGVAHNTALKARAANCKRREKERLVTPPVPHNDQADWGEIQLLLDAELIRLPDKYRKPILLCELEGKTHKEAAAMLGWPVGTLAGRLSRARALLGKRLSRRGLSVSGTLLAVMFAQNVARASVPATLSASVVKTAMSVAAGHAMAGVVSAKVAALTHAVLKGMLLAKIKITVALAFVVTIVGTGLGTLAYQAGVTGQNGPGKQRIDAAIKPVQAPTQLADQRPALANDPRKDTEEKFPRSVLKVPKVVLDAVRKRFPDAKFVRANKELDGGKVIFEVAIRDQEQDIDVMATADGKLQSIEKEIAVKDIPKVVADALAAKYPNASYELFREVFRVKGSRETLTCYEAMLTTDGASFEVQVTANGRILKANARSREEK